MKFPYVPVLSKPPIPPLGGTQVRHRPVIATRLTTNANWRICDALLDTGADDTVFSDMVAGDLGIDLTQAQHLPYVLVGRPQPVICRFAHVKLRIADAIEEYERPAIVGFINAPSRYALLGQTGFLQFFTAEFDGGAHIVTLTPNSTFPGRIQKK